LAAGDAPGSRGIDDELLVDGFGAATGDKSDTVIVCGVVLFCFDGVSKGDPKSYRTSPVGRFGGAYICDDTDVTVDVVGLIDGFGVDVVGS